MEEPGSPDNSNVRIETLDFCFEKQVNALNFIITQLDDIETTYYVQKWLEIFSKATTDEKLARNCLATLMHEQLTESGALSGIFINSDNWKKNLNLMLQEVDKECDEMLLNSCNEINLQNSDENDLKQSNEEENKYQSEPVLNPVTVENEYLYKELSLSRAKIMEQEVIIRALQSKMENEMMKPKICNEKSKENMQKVMINTIAQFLHKNQVIKSEDNGRLHVRLFERTCGWMCQEPWFINQMSVFDDAFEQILTNQFESELTKAKNALALSATKAFHKVHKNLHKKHKRRLALQKQKYVTQLGLIKLEIFGKLRQIFVHLHFEDNPDMWNVLAEMEQKYEEIANDVIRKIGRADSD